VIVLESIHDQFTQRLIEAVRSLTIGPAEEPGTKIGPVIDDEARERLQNFIRKVDLENGTQLLLAVDPGPLAKKGSYIGPHIFTGVDPDSALAQQELFGPILSILRVRTLDDAFNIANNTRYALTGGVYSRSPVTLRLRPPGVPRRQSVPQSRNHRSARQSASVWRLSNVRNRQQSWWPRLPPAISDPHRDFRKHDAARLCSRNLSRFHARFFPDMLMFHLQLIWLLARNSLIRELMFPANFAIQVVTRLFWFAARVVLFQLIYQQTDSIREWSREEYFAFMATGMLINSLVEAFFMPNCAAFCDSIRTGKLDLVLTRPVDAQFLVSLQRINPAMVTQTVLALSLLLMSLARLEWPATLLTACVYIFYVVIAVAFFYALMITTACTSVWFGRNQGLYDFWFYITIFAAISPKHL
jgi:ABC-2 type transport system permease protein